MSKDDADDVTVGPQENTKARFDADARDRGFVVGYRRPPLHSRFKPGMSGNPRGRPKGSKNLDSLCHSLLSRKVTIQEAGGRRKVTAVEAILLASIQRALRGDNRAAKLVLDVQNRIPAAEDTGAGDHTNAEDQAIVAAYLAKLQARGRQEEKIEEEDRTNIPQEDTGPDAA